jgi:hypothetical protein
VDVLESFIDFKEVNCAERMRYRVRAYQEQQQHQGGLLRLHQEDKNSVFKPIQRHHNLEVGPVDGDRDRLQCRRRCWQCSRTCCTWSSRRAWTRKSSLRAEGHRKDHLLQQRPREGHRFRHAVHFQAPDQGDLHREQRPKGPEAGVGES